MNATHYAPDVIDLLVIARSTNTNSFGLREHLLADREGNGYRALRSAYSPEADLWASHTIHAISVDGDPEADEKASICTALRLAGFEVVSALARGPSPVLAEVWRDVTTRPQTVRVKGGVL